MKIIYPVQRTSRMLAMDVAHGEVVRHENSGCVIIRIFDATTRRLRPEEGDTLPFVDLKTGQLWYVRLTSQVTPLDAAVVVE